MTKTVFEVCCLCVLTAVTTSAVSCGNESASGSTTENVTGGVAGVSGAAAAGSGGRIAAGQGGSATGTVLDAAVAIEPDAGAEIEDASTADAATPTAGSGGGSGAAGAAGGGVAGAAGAAGGGVAGAAGAAGGGVAGAAGAAGAPATTATSRYDYTTDVAPILMRYCVGCHGPSDVGPFRLDSYAGAREYASVSVAAVVQRVMPPCGETPGGCSPPADQIAILQEWAEGGRPETL